MRNFVMPSKKLNFRILVVISLFTSLVLNAKTSELPKLSLTASKSILKENDSFEIEAKLNSASVSDVLIDIDVSGSASFFRDFLINFDNKGQKIIVGKSGAGNQNDQLRFPRAITSDNSGNLFIADYENGRIVKWEPGASTGIVLITNLNGPSDIFVDSLNNIYVIESSANIVSKWASPYVTRQVVAGTQWQSGSDNSHLNNPSSFFIDKNEDIYISDSNNNRIIKWIKNANTGIVIAGGNGQGNDSTRLSNPSGIWVDENNTLWITDKNNSRIMKWKIGEESGKSVLNSWGVVDINRDSYGNWYILYDTSGELKRFNPNFKNPEILSNLTGDGLYYKFNSPYSIYTDKSNNIFICDTYNNRIIKHQNSPQILIPAGNTSGKISVNINDDSSFEKNESILFKPNKITNAEFDSFDPVILTISDNDTKPEITIDYSSGTLEEGSSMPVTISASTNIAAGVDIQIHYNISGDTPSGLYSLSADKFIIPADESEAIIYISSFGLEDNLVDIIRKINFKIDSISNGFTESPDFSIQFINNDQPDVNISLSSSSVNETESLNLTGTLSAETSKDVFVDFSTSDSSAKENRDYIINNQTTGTKIYAGSTSEGYGDNFLRYPAGIFVDRNRNTYICDRNNGRIMKWPLNGTSGKAIITNIPNPCDIFVDSLGTIYVAEIWNQVVSKWEYPYTSKTIVAGIAGVPGNDLSSLNSPISIYVDKNSSIYISDLNNSRVVKWVKNASKGIIVAGGNGVGSDSTQLNNPMGIFVDNDETLYVADHNNSRIVKWTKGAKAGKVVSYGSGYTDITKSNDGYWYTSEDWGQRIVKHNSGFQPVKTLVSGWGSSETNIKDPFAIATDWLNNVYISDQNNHRILKYQQSNQIKIPAGSIKGQTSIQIINDSSYEDNEILNFTPVYAQNAILKSTEKLALTIEDNDTKPILNFSFNNNKITENSKSKVKLNIQPNFISGKDIYFRLKYIGDAPMDLFRISAYEKIIPAGDSIATIELSTDGLEDNDVDILRNITFSVDSISNASVGKQPISLYFESNDNPTFNISAISKINEGDSTLVTVDLSEATSKDIMIDFNFLAENTANENDVKYVFNTRGSKIIAGGNGEGYLNNQLRYPKASIIDKDGNLYVADTDNGRIIKWTKGAKEGVNLITGLYRPRDIFIDSIYNIYVVEDYAHVVSKWSMPYNQRVIVAGVWLQNGLDSVHLNNPNNVHVTASGDMFIADGNNHRILKWKKDAKSGTIVAGGNNYGNDSTQLNTPYAVYVDNDETLFIADHHNSRIVKWLKGAKSGKTIFWGNGFTDIAKSNNGKWYTVEDWGERVSYFDSKFNFKNYIFNGQGSGINQLKEPYAVTFDEYNNIVISDANNHRILKFQESPQILIPAGQKSGSLMLKTINDSIYEKTETIALEVKSATNSILPVYRKVLVAITDNDTIPEVRFALSANKISEGSSEKVKLNATTSIESGVDIISSFSISGDAPAYLYTISSKEITIKAGETSASLEISTEGLEDDKVDILRSIIFKLDSIKNASTSFHQTQLKFENNDDPYYSINFSTDTIAEHESVIISATISEKTSKDVIINLDVDGTAGYESDYNFVFPTQGPKVVAGGNGEGSKLNQFRNPRNISLDRFGNIFVADFSNGRILKFKPNESTGISVIQHYLNGPTDVFVDSVGSVYVVESFSNIVTKWDYPYTFANRTVVAGIENSNGNELNQLSCPQSIFVDAKNNIYISDHCNFRIMKWSKGAKTGQIVAGGNGSGSNLNQLSYPQGIYIDKEENIFIADRNNNRIVKWSNGSNTGVNVIYGAGANDITRDKNGNWYISNEWDNTFMKYNSDFTKYTRMNPFGQDFYQLNNPAGITVDRLNNVYVCDQNNQRILKYQISPQIKIVAGEQSSEIKLNSFDEDINEDNENVKLKVNSVSNAIALKDSNYLVTILDNTKKLSIANDPFIGLLQGKVSWGDYDMDGDMDVAVMGLSPYLGAITRLYENKNGSFVDTKQNFRKTFDGDISWVDLNKDGWIDLVISGVSMGDPSTTVYMNNQGKYFEPKTNYNLPDLYSTTMAWGDLDNDGDIDVAISGINSNDEYVFNLFYKNDTSEIYIKETDFNYPGFINGDLKIGDFDLDGDNDIVYSGENFTGSPVGSIILNTFIKSEGFRYNYWGNDNILNLNMKNTSIEFQKFGFETYNMMTMLCVGEINPGVGKFTSSETQQFAGIANLMKGDITSGDFNNDGMLDLLMTGENEKAVPVTKLYIQKKSQSNMPAYGQFYFEEYNEPIIGLRESSADLIDFDMDGDLDIFLTGIDNDGLARTILYKSDIIHKPNIKPNKVTGLKLTDLGNGKVKFSWDIPADDHSKYLGYNLRLGKTAKGSEFSNTESDLITGRKLINKPASIYNNFFETQLDPGLYYWSVQAVDAGNKAGEFSEESSFPLMYEWKVLNQGGIVDRTINGQIEPNMKLGDIDNDGDLDLLYGSGTNSGLNLYKYNGKQLVKENNNPFYAEKLKNAEVGDINGDGIMDLLIIEQKYDNSNWFKLFISQKNSNPSAYTVLEKKGLFNAKGKIKDLNNDGIAEILITGMSSATSTAKTKLFMYNLDFSNYTFIETDLSPQIQNTSLQGSAYDLGDFDNDQDIDFIISGLNTYTGLESKIYKNTTVLGSSYTLTSTNDNFAPIRDGSVDFVDFDSDGDLDILITGTGEDGDLFEVYMNKLEKSTTVWVRVSLGMAPIRQGKIDLGDFNGDGFADLLYSGISQGEGKVTRLAEYNPYTMKYDNSQFDVSDITDGVVEFGDLDGDGDLDFTISGQNKLQIGTYNFKTYINVRSESAQVINKLASSRVNSGKFFRAPLDSISNIYVVNKAPSIPVQIGETLRTDIPSTTGKYAVELSWNPSDDDYTPTPGLTYALRIGTSPNSEDILSSTASLSGFRKAPGKGNAEHNTKWKISLTPGTYFWSVQSVDASYAGSQFSSTRSFTVSQNNIITENQTMYFDESTIRLYPNPTKDKYLFIEHQATENSIPQRIELFDLKGEKIKNFEIQQINDHIQKLKIDDLKYGVYMLKIYTFNTSIVRKVIILE